MVLHHFVLLYCAAATCTYFLCFNDFVNRLIYNIYEYKWDAVLRSRNVWDPIWKKGARIMDQ
jgi:hypothetical protein